MKSRFEKLLIKSIRKAIRICSDILQIKREDLFLEVKLKGGLCNKLFCLFSACEIALANNQTLIEPYFGWKKRILFSDIYDIDAFNNAMRPYANGKDLMIPRKQSKWSIKTINETVFNTIDLWKHSEKNLREQRKCNKIAQSSMSVMVLKALQLKEEYHSISQKYSDNLPFTGVQIRTESDWENHTKGKEFPKDETVLIGHSKLVRMLGNHGVLNKLFFTSGENHKTIEETFSKGTYEVAYFFVPYLEYEINAAINFEICCNATQFVGLSRSTYSNLISMKRALENKGASFIYNYRDRIYKRVDKGLHTEAMKSIQNQTKLY